MSNSGRWFKAQSEQNIRTNLAQLPVIAGFGPNIQTQPNKDDHSEVSFFEVCVSEVGGDEVVG